MNKKELSERDICTKFITPALRRAGWDEQTQLREEVTFTKGRVIGSVFHDRSVTSGVIERNLSLDDFPSPAVLWARYREWQGLPPEADDIVLQDYFSDGSGKGPRYYQAMAVNAATESIAKGQQRLLLEMATGTGKTYTAFRIIWRLWKAGRKRRDPILGRSQRPHRSDDGQ